MLTTALVGRLPPLGGEASLRGMEQRNFRETVTVVTGAGRGIGAAIARRFAGAGSNLVVIARDGGQLEGVAHAVRGLGSEALVIAADLTDPAVTDRVVEETVARFGRLDVLVNNAGGAAPTPFGETTGPDLTHAFQLNVVCSFALTKRAVPHLLESDRASVINISSRMDRLVARGLLTYGTVKAATSQMTRLLAAELAPRIRVNGIAPGVVATEGLTEALDDPTRQHILAATPLHRLATVEDVANAAVWLASPESSYITGKIIELDGGAERPVFPDASPDLPDR
jgi:7-alpha-hydroxysteroid dehydrogenase